MFQWKNFNIQLLQKFPLFIKVPECVQSCGEKTDFLYSVQYVVTPSWLEIFSWQLETPLHRSFWENV